MNAMMEIKDVDRELTKALRREDPPAGFAERVLRRATTREGSLHEAGFFRLAAAAAIVAAVAGGFEYRAMQRERAEGEAAKARVVLALQIAGSKLQLIQSKITRIHDEPAKNSNQ
jgi:anti-sigma-K factor RskA